MIYIDINGKIIENEKIDSLGIDSINFKLNKKYNNVNLALKINFANNLNENIRYIRKIIYLQNHNIDFVTVYKGIKIKYIILNSNDDIITAIRGYFIKDKKDKYLYLYDSKFKALDKIWNTCNPCKFCNDVCIASKNHKAAQEKDGCCYSFDYCKDKFKLIDNIHLCDYLGKDKKCTTENISCKYFVCKYLKKSKLFNLNMNEDLVIQSFFTNKQKLILKYNFFKSKEEIIEKLLEDNHIPFFIYYMNGDYRISSK